MRANRYFIFLISFLLLISVQLAGCIRPLKIETTETPEPFTTDTPKGQVEYRSAEYGFSFSLPASWEGYRISINTWEGMESSDQGNVIAEQGPTISIVHPESSSQHPRQDIPIMIFTTEQWDQMQQDEWHIGAAPIGPGELGRNDRYVLAIPARYNYAFPEGWEEVEQILQNQPILVFEPGDVP